MNAQEELIKKVMKEHRKTTKLIEMGKLKECKYDNPKDFFKQIPIQ